jgi:hypothetical protein
MLNKLARYKALNDRGQWLASGHHVEVYWDDTNEAIVVYDYDNSADTTPTTRTSGPDLGARSTDFQIIENYLNDRLREGDDQIRGYTFCDGANLQYFNFTSLFPYATKISSPSHFSCALNVCDLQISDTYIVQGASDFVTPDGAFEVTATSSNGSYKFSLDPDFDYYTEGQTTGLFAGVYAGQYTITAKDEIGCVDTITLTVPVPDFYNPLYRLEYTDHNDLPTRVDILERGYTGEVTEVCGDADPFILKYNGSGEINKFTPIIPSEARLTIMSETNFQFRDLFSEDERKYQVRYYKDYGNTVSTFTPATLPPLADWVVHEDPDFTGQPNWITGAIPYTEPSISSTLPTDQLYTAYAFEAGKTYSFAYNFLGVTSTLGHASTANVTYEIRIVSSDMTLFNHETLVKKIVNFYGPDGSNGSYEFVAPEGADGIVVIVVWHPNGSQQRYTIQSFTNTTPTTGAGDAGYELKWLGYVISSNYREAYLAPPYPVQVVATDGLADLKTYDYLDKDGNKYREDQIALTAISEILSKTDLDINILSAINRYEEDMLTGANDDPLNQCKFNPETFYQNNSIMKCSEVLGEILKPFGARILQRNGKWCMYSIEEFVTSAPYREFDSAGLLLGNGTIDDVVNIQYPVIQSRAAFRN